MNHTRTAHRTVLSALLVAGLAASCASTDTTSQAQPAPTAPPLSLNDATELVISPDTTTTYNTDRTGDRLTVTNTDQPVHHRQITFTGDQRDATTGQCVTITDAIEPVTEHGVALRVSGDTALTVTAAPGINNAEPFAVTTWIRRGDGNWSENTQDRHRLAGFDHNRAAKATLPWTLCAVAINYTVTLKAWPGDIDEPDWNDSNYTATTELDPGATHPGRTGIYTAHLAPGQTANLTGLAPTD